MPTHKEPIIALDAEVFMRDVAIMQEAGKSNLLRTLYYIVRALDVEIDFSQARVPGNEELEALYEVSPDCARLVTAYSDLITEARRKTAPEKENNEQPE